MKAWKAWKALKGDQDLTTALLLLQVPEGALPHRSALGFPGLAGGVTFTIYGESCAPPPRVEGPSPPPRLDQLAASAPVWNRFS